MATTADAATLTRAAEETADGRGDAGDRPSDDAHSVLPRGVQPVAPTVHLHTLLLGVHDVAARDVTLRDVTLHDVTVQAPSPGEKVVSGGGLR